MERCAKSERRSGLRRNTLPTASQSFLYLADKNDGNNHPSRHKQETRILPPSTAELLFLGRKERFTWLSLREKTQTVIFGSRKRQKVCFAVLRAGTIFAAVSTGWRRVIGKDNSILCDCDRTYRHIVFSDIQIRGAAHQRLALFSCRVISYVRSDRFIARCAF